MELIFSNTLLVRNFVLNYISGLSHEQLLKIPSGFNNNIAWNLGHILTTQQLLSYGLSDNELNIPKHYVPMYSKGSSPAVWQKPSDTDEIKNLLILTIGYFESDYLAGKFAKFKEYTTSMGMKLNKIEDVLHMNYGHEMQHIGIIQSITKLVK